MVTAVCTYPFIFLHFTHCTQNLLNFRHVVKGFSIDDLLIVLATIFHFEYSPDGHAITRNLSIIDNEMAG